VIDFKRERPIDSHENPHAAHGAMSQMTLANGLTEQICYDNRLQPRVVRAGIVTSTNCALQGSDLLHLSFDYRNGSQDNGNVWSQTIRRKRSDNTILELRQDYTYDGVNRITGVTEYPASGGAL
jgi:hypothetical protein